MEDSIPFLAVKLQWFVDPLSWLCKEIIMKRILDGGLENFPSNGFGVQQYMNVN